MELKITTIIPTDDEEIAGKLLNNLIYNQAVVLGIIVGNDSWSINIIQKTDKVAWSRNQVRRAVWIRNPEIVRTILQALFSKSGKTMPADQSYLITTSMDDRIFDLITSSEPDPDYVRIDKAFLLAEKA
jgi:hypothetical protein